MEFSCLSCSKEFVVQDYELGDNVECAHCSAVMSTDWDYMDYDNLAVWPASILLDDEVLDEESELGEE